MKIVKGAGGIDIAVYEAGNPQGPALLFIHGFSQAALSWKKQFESDLAKTYRLVALDMRGHGASGKPMEPSAYDSAEPFAGDLQAILDGLGLDKVVAVWIAAGDQKRGALRGQRLGRLEADAGGRARNENGFSLHGLVLPIRFGPLSRW